MKSKKGVSNAKVPQNFSFDYSVDILDRKNQIPLLGGLPQMGRTKTTLALILVRLYHKEIKWRL